MHPCPCCGYRTLPARGDYEVCPVCWWEDEGLEPREFSGPNGTTLVEAQQTYLRRRLPHRLRRGVRPPRAGEERDPDWRPFELTEELLARVAESHAEWQRSFDEFPVPDVEEPPLDPGPFAAYVARIHERKDAGDPMSVEEVRAVLDELGDSIGVRFEDAQREMMAHLLLDDGYYRRSPLRTAWWLVRYARPGTFRRRWAEIRAGGIRFAG